MAGTGDDNTTSDDPRWFFNPEVGRLASRELAFVAEWVGHERAAKKFLRDLLTDGRLPWHAEIVITDDPKTPHELWTSLGAVRRAFWDIRDYPAIDWEASSAIYTGPAMRLVRKPDGSKHVEFDCRVQVSIAVDFIRFHHPTVVHELQIRGLMPRDESEPTEQLPASEPPVPQEELSLQQGAEGKILAKVWVTAKAQQMARCGEIPEGISKTKFAKLLAGDATIAWRYIRNHLEDWGLWPPSAIE
jgi:hypothetical protein